LDEHLVHELVEKILSRKLLAQFAQEMVGHVSCSSSVTASHFWA
jgi:hypothetical protein